MSDPFLNLLGFRPKFQFEDIGVRLMPAHDPKAKQFVFVLTCRGNTERFTFQETSDPVKIWAVIMDEVLEGI